MEKQQYQTTAALITLPENCEQLNDEIGLTSSELYALHSIEIKKKRRALTKEQSIVLTAIERADLVRQFHFICKAEILAGVHFHLSADDIIKRILNEINKLELTNTKLYPECFEALSEDEMITIPFSLGKSIQLLHIALFSPYNFSEKVEYRITMKILDKIMTPEADAACLSSMIGE